MNKSFFFPFELTLLLRSKDVLDIIYMVFNKDAIEHLSELKALRRQTSQV